MTTEAAHTPEGLPVYIEADHPWHWPQVGQVVATEIDESWAISSHIGAEFVDDHLVSFAAWIDRAVGQLLETRDPTANGWFRSDFADGRWFMTATMRTLG